MKWSVLIFWLLYSNVGQTSDPNCPNDSETPSAYFKRLFQTRPHSAIDSYLPVEYRKAVNQVQSCAKLKSGFFAKVPESCLTRFNSVSKMYVKDGRHNYGFKVTTDDEYRQHQLKNYPFPKELIDQTLFNELGNISSTADDRKEKIDQAIERINKLKSINPGMRVVNFDGKSDVSVNNESKGRILVFWPGQGSSKVDRLIAFVVPEVSEKKIWDMRAPDPGQTSVITIDRSGETPKTFYIDYWRKYQKGPEDKRVFTELTTRDKVHPDNPSERCLNCHTNGPLSILPGSIDSKLYSKDLQFINTYIAGLAPQDPFLKKEDSISLTPPVGPVESPYRTNDFFKKCTTSEVWQGNKIKKESLKGASLERVKSAMKCTHCHDGDYRGQLGLPAWGSGGGDMPFIFDRIIASHTTESNRQEVEKIVGSWASKNKKFEDHTAFSMPADQTLSTTEVKALYSCLQLEYFGDSGQSGLLLDWLTYKGDAGMGTCFGDSIVEKSPLEILKSINDDNCDY